MWEQPSWFGGWRNPARHQEMKGLTPVVLLVFALETRIIPVGFLSRFRPSVVGGLDWFGLEGD